MDYVTLEDWLGHLVQMDRKPATIESYRLYVRKCLDTLKANGCATEPGKIGKAELYLLRKELDVSEDTKKAYLKVLGQFIEFHTGANPMKDAGMLWNNTTPNRLFITTSDFERVFEVATAQERLILLLGGMMGLRRCEIVRLRYSDIKNGRILVHGKGHTEDGKTVWMKAPQTVLDAIDRWTEERKKLDYIDDETSGEIIVCVKSRHYLEPCTPTYISHLIQRLGTRAGVKITPHSLRRLFCTTLHENGIDLVYIKTLMRHENINTTINCYIDANPRKTDAIMESVESFFI